MHWKSEGRYRRLRPKTARASLIFFFPPALKSLDQVLQLWQWSKCTAVLFVRVCVPAPVNWTSCRARGCVRWFKNRCYWSQDPSAKLSPAKASTLATNTPASFTIRAAQKIKKIRCKPDKEGKKRARAGKRQKKKGKRERTRMYPHWM